MSKLHIISSGLYSRNLTQFSKMFAQQNGFIQCEHGQCMPVPTYLSDVLLLLFFEGKFNEDLLQLLITVVDNELLKAVVLSDKTFAFGCCGNTLELSWSRLLQQLQARELLY